MRRTIWTGVIPLFRLVYQTGLLLDSYCMQVSGDTPASIADADRPAVSEGGALPINAQYLIKTGSMKPPIKCPPCNDEAPRVSHCIC